jgi:LacI family transcriptional regulator
MRTTLHDIAQKAGVSLITVSRALNDHPDVSPETRQRIQRIAGELNYIPNLQARALAGGQSQTLGLVVADNANPYYARLIRAVEDTARGAGYSVILCNTAEDAGRELQAEQMLRAKGVDGMLITSIQSGSEPLRQLEAEGMPFVLLNRYLDDYITDCVLNDNRQGAYDLTAHLCRLGHQRIAHLTGPEQISSVRERLEGYRQALAESGAAYDPALVLRCDLGMEDGCRQVEALLNSATPRPTAVFAYSDLLALGVLRALHARGMQVPRDMALAGYDDIEFAALVEPPLTTVAQQAYQIGQKGAELLIQKIQRPQSEPWPCQRIVYKPQLIIRSSSGSAVTYTQP